MEVVRRNGIRWRETLGARPRSNSAGCHRDPHLQLASLASGFPKS
jgi:hypothetical protein